MITANHIFKFTGKNNIVYVNKEVFKAFNNFLKDENPEDDFFIFKSRQGYNKPISKQRAWQLIQDWTGSINLKGNYGTHTLRKTFGYIQRTHFGVSWEILCKRYNHSNPAVTMCYLGITGDEVTNILQNEI
ncbi:MAG: tyrosine-type recombinase/integrase [Desulforegulaceae bacterium]|nr:tyrosine-type recombinase/integrase [Desulforegulaceae bacterium]